MSGDIELENSIVVGSELKGKGKLNNSVVVSSNIRDPFLNRAFSVNSFRAAKTVLEENSGIYNSIGHEELKLKEGMRHVSVLSPIGKKDMLVSEELDLSCADNYFRAVFGNELSFSEASDIMNGICRQELKARRRCEVEKIKRIERKKEMFKSLRFGTSGLRDKVEAMTDMECYINTRGFLNFLARNEGLERGSKVAIGGDRRKSTPRISRAVAKAVADAGHKVAFCGKVPSPVLAYFALSGSIPSIMITGSHIPAGRNGIKFTKTTGEVLKSDEKSILKEVEGFRNEEYAKSREASIFDEKGAFKCEVASLEDTSHREALDLYISRYTEVFPKDALKGERIVLYQHSAVGRHLLKELLEALGGVVICVEPSEEFVPVDTEKIGEDVRRKFRFWAGEHEAFALVSTDGDSDRPLFADETGEILPGDKLGALSAICLKPDFAAVPVSANDAMISALREKNIEVEKTKIGSPYVIKAMLDKLSEDNRAHVAGWESNGGFLLGSDLEFGDARIKALPTRDAVIPLLCPMLLALREGKTVSAVIGEELPRRVTSAGVVDKKVPGCENYTSSLGKKIIRALSPKRKEIKRVDFSGGEAVAENVRLKEEELRRLERVKTFLEELFSVDKDLNSITELDFTDGVRILFSSRNVAHLRPSGNAPEFRIYSASDDKKKADEIVALKDRILPHLIREVKEKNGKKEGSEK